MKVKDYPVLFLLASLSLVCKLAVAEENSLSAWTLKGFGTFAATGTDSDRIGFYRDKSQTQDADSGWGLTTDSRLGLQVDWRASDSLQAAVQWVARDHAGNFFEQNLDWAFLRWQLPNDLTIRLGRLGSDFVLMSDYRNIGYAYPWMRPPQEFYASIPFYHFDGIDIAKKFSLSDGQLMVKAFGGRMYNEYSSATFGSIQQQASVAGASLRYENNDWKWFLSHAYVQILSEFPIQPLENFINSPLVRQSWSNLQQISPALRIKGSQFHYDDIGFIYDNGTWLSQSELAYMSSETQWLPAKIQSYFSLGRRFSTLTVYSLFGIVKSFQHDINVPPPTLSSPALLIKQQQIHNLLNDNGFNEQSISIGSRWDFHDNMALKAQWTHYWLGNIGTQQWQKPADNIIPHTVNVMSVGIDFVF